MRRPRRRPARPPLDPARKACADIVAVIDAVETRCLLSDQDVTPTLQEMTEQEMGRIYRAAKRGLR